MSATYIPTNTIYHGGINVPVDAVDPVNAASVNTQGLKYLSDDTAYLRNKLGAWIDGGVIQPSGPITVQGVGGLAIPSGSVYFQTLQVDGLLVSANAVPGRTAEFDIPLLSTAVADNKFNNLRIPTSPTGAPAQNRLYVDGGMIGGGFDTLAAVPRISRPFYKDTGGWILMRVNIGPNADTTISVGDFDIYSTPSTMSGIHTWQIVEPVGSVAPDGSVIWIRNFLGTFALVITNPAAAIIGAVNPGVELVAVKLAGVWTLL